MRKVIYGMVVSLDGFISGPNGELDWHIPDEELHRHANEQQRSAGVNLYGRRMYEVMDYWRTAHTDPSLSPHELEFARAWQDTPTVVFSRTLESVEGNARLAGPNVAEEVRKLKQESGGDMVVGGAGLAASLIDLGLVDEYELYIHPVILGAGVPMFARAGDTINLHMLEPLPFASGVTLLRYERATP
jgi:dihydrofolate reductase